MLPSRAQAWIGHQRARNAARSLLAELAAAKVPSLLFKGIVLAYDIYRDVGERPVSDVDLLVRPSDFLRVVWIARRRGWARVWDSRSPGVVNISVDGMFCDVSAFVGPAGISALSVGALIAAGQTTTRGLGFLHTRPELNDHVLLMAIDLFKDKFAWAKAHAREDLLRLAAHEDFRPARLVQRAREARLTTLLGIIADWILEADAAEGWAHVRRLVRPSEVRQRYAVRYRRAATTATASYPFRAGLIARMVSDAPLRRVLGPLLGAAGLALYFGAGHRLPANLESYEQRLSRCEPKADSKRAPDGES